MISVSSTGVSGRKAYYSDYGLEQAEGFNAVAKSAAHWTFEVMTPAGGVRLQSERNREDAIQMELDATADPPQPLVTITRTRGSRVVQSDTVLSKPLSQLTEDDVVEMLLEELRPWLS